MVCRLHTMYRERYKKFDVRLKLCFPTSDTFIITFLCKLLRLKFYVRIMLEDAKPRFVLGVVTIIQG
jgi:hypothetical protein